MKIAIIGSGIAGLSCAYHLDKDHQVVVYEKNNYLGGHTDTHQLQVGNQSANIDSGFIVFAKELYPNFSRMLDDLGVASKPTDMSFSVVNESSGLVYNATNLNKMFCQRRNLLNPVFYRMIADIIRFYRSAPKVLNGDDHTTSVATYLRQRGYSETFMRDHLFPMIGALWSAAPATVECYPIRYLIEYMSSHGMMNLWQRPQWRVLTNGSNEYVQRLTEKLQQTDFRLHCGVTNIIRTDDNVLIHASSCEPETFDAVVIATHADQAKILLHLPSDDEREILSAIGFQRNDVVVHTDSSVMPANRQAWASWNARVTADHLPHCSATYWMNSLQGLELSEDVFVSLNEDRPIDKDSILQKRTYHHPVYTADSVTARRRLSYINGQNRTVYAGAYWGWSFHEDGARSGMEAAKIVSGFSHS